MALYPMRLITVRLSPRNSEGKLSGIITQNTVRQALSPMDCDASTTPASTSFKALSTTRATKGIAAIVRGTIAALVPNAVPTRNRVKGMSNISKMMKGTLLPRLTITSKTALRGLLGRMPFFAVTATTMPIAVPKIAAITVDTNTMYSVSPVAESNFCTYS